MMSQAARRHASDVEACADELRVARERYVSLASLANGAPPAEGGWWRTRATADLMQVALRAATAAAPEEDRAADQHIKRRRRGEPRQPLAHSIAHAASALRPRIRRFVSLRVVSDDRLDAAVAKTLESLARCAPAFGTAVLRTWVGAWATTYRRGEGSAPCLVCGREGGDAMGHLARCRTLWSAVARVTEIPVHSSMAEFMCIVRSPASPGTSKKHRERPPSAVMRVAVGGSAAK